MLIELWERLRGYDKWIETDARVDTSKMKETAHADRGGNVSYTYSSEDVLVWTDVKGEEQRGYFQVPDDSSLYMLVGGETVRIRYNPAQPDQFYMRDLLKTRVHTVATRVGVAVLFGAIIVVYEWLKIKYLGPRWGPG